MKRSMLDLQYWIARLKANETIYAWSAKKGEKIVELKSKSSSGKVTNAVMPNNLRIKKKKYKVLNPFHL